MQSRLLSVSYDPVLLQTRHLLLSRAGYEVTSVVGFAEAIERSSDHFDLVIMGHSIPQPDKREIVRALRSGGCNAPVLALIRQNEPPLQEAAASIDTDPERLMQATATLLAPSNAHNSD